MYRACWFTTSLFKSGKNVRSGAEIQHNSFCCFLSCGKEPFVFAPPNGASPLDRSGMGLEHKARHELEVEQKVDYE
jgi:hypothetical protein